VVKTLTRWRSGLLLRLLLRRPRPSSHLVLHRDHTQPTTLSVSKIHPLPPSLLLIPSGDAVGGGAVAVEEWEGRRRSSCEVEGTDVAAAVAVDSGSRELGYEW